MSLMRSTSAIALAIGASLAVGVCTPADALPFSLAASATGSDDLETLTFSKFDPALGTLTGVVFTLNQENFTDAQVSASFSAGEGGSASATVSSSFLISFNPSPTLFSGSGSATASCSASFGSSCSSPAASSSTDASFPPTSTVTTPSVLAGVTGLGGFFDVFVELEVDASVGSCLGNFSPAACNANGNAVWEGVLTVAFQFDPTPVANPVPVPATLGLLGMGLIGLAAGRRRA